MDVLSLMRTEMSGLTIFMNLDNIYSLTICLFNSIPSTRPSVTSHPCVVFRSKLGMPPSSSANRHENAHLSIQILFLRVLMGTPSGINIRNVVWHGFINPASFNFSARQYTNLMVVLLMTIVGRVKCHLPVLKCRNTTDLGGYFTGHPLSISPQNSRFIHQGDPKLPFYDAPLTTSILTDITNLISSSRFPIPHTQILYETAIAAFINSDNYIFLVTVVPVIEHALRWQYVHVHGLDISRYYTADSVVQYLTINVLIAPQVANGGRNKLVDVVGIHTMVRSHTTCYCSVPNQICNLHSL